MEKKIQKLMEQLGSECDNLAWFMVAFMLALCFTPMGKDQALRMVAAILAFVTAASFYSAMKCRLLVPNADIRGIIWFAIGIFEILNVMYR